MHTYGRYDVALKSAKGVTAYDENGKKYMNITIATRREPDKYENTHTVFMSQTKEEREAGTGRIYIGSGKGFDFTPAATTPESVDQMPVASDTDDLPF